MRITDHIAKWIVGGLFIFSGFIKINDPIGTEIKLEEYFEVFASDFGSFFHYFIPFALPIGVVLIVMEVLFGFMVLINYRMRFTVRVLLAMIAFFTFLTFYSAYFNKVTDCGCFGDAIPLTPWQSFYKDIILSILIIYLFIRQNKYIPVFRSLTSKTIVGFVIVVTLIIGVLAIQHLPFLDFRAYKIGDNIEKNMLPEEEPIFEYVFRKDGQLIRSQQYLPEKEGYKYVEFQILNPKKATPKITDYNVWNEEHGDYTAETFRGIKMIIIISDVLKANTSEIEKINHLISRIEKNVEVLAFTASDGTLFESFRHEQQLAIPYFFVDDTVLKAMIRSNPGLILLQNGTVAGKWHYNDVPGIEQVLTLLVKNP